MGVAKEQAVEIDHTNAEAADMVNAAYTAKKIGPRQYRAMMRHAGNHSPEHIQRMITLMSHETFREAHRIVMHEVGK